MRILLVCVVAFLGAWMTFLRPKDDAAPPAETTAAPNTQTAEPAITDPGKAVEAAQDAVAATNGDTATAAGSTGTATQPAATPGAAVASDLKGIPPRVRRAIRQDDVVVLLFWNRKGADDRDVRRSLERVDRWDGRVTVQAAPLSAISRYGRIARGLDVNQSPTVVVVDPELRAETIVGFTDTQTIDQLVVDAFKNTTGLFTSSYLREVNSVCAGFGNSLYATPSSSTRAEYASQLKVNHRKAIRFQSAFAAVPAPKRFAAFKRASVADNAAMVAVLADARAALASSSGAAGAIAVSDRYSAKGAVIDRRWNRRVEGQHLLSCGSQY